MNRHNANDPAATRQYYIGVDVGTSSARATIIASNGVILATASQTIAIHHPLPNHYEQSSADIWQQVCAVTKDVVAMAHVDPAHVAGIGFDATCSLVAVSATDTPVAVSTTHNAQWNIIMWMDHRADQETAVINATRHAVLDCTGGQISIEMEMPKLLWLHRHLPDTCKDAAHFFDLPDYLTWKATGGTADRSQCSLACKWTYLPKATSAAMGRTEGFQRDFLELIGLGGLDVGKLQSRLARAVGERAGYLSEQAAAELGLTTKVAVGVSMIDAYAGAIATLAVPDTNPNNNLALISGTSSCHIAMSDMPIAIPGVWGPYEGVLLPEMFAMEGGQSAAGKLIDHVLASHPCFAETKDKATGEGKTIYEHLNAYLHRLANDKKCHMAALTQHLHVLPDFHGNRSPLSDATLRGMISGLDLDASVHSLALLYLATTQALALQTRHIIDEANTAGHDLRRICMSGGLAQNAVYVQVHADVTRLDVVLPKYPDASVVHGAAVLGAAATGAFGGLWDTMRALTQPGDTVHPSADPSVVAFYDKKYRAFHAMYDHQRALREIMS
ncbi:FGGY-family pentulose kinase [Allomyces macrogynus ATCC 38327]|uniref:FGGY-family pentulose kinase n=1 Tax=Allomyces macrogynus (strain ATCC 38327) TaxID=578462 RepID=A0A0L0S8U5_ALLM3|nr:FGGY-family pentulose kinase [Allomyces macrogynus ATCC 38327]|eukprot:KNE58897.1 FGGY-family pentulose kinase [Allomyces macrogynus ATCC 38327]